MSSGAGTAIFVDEIGIEVGIVGEFRLRASYQPVFTRRGDLLSAVAVRGSTTPFHHGQVMSLSAFHDATLPRHSFALTALEAALNFRNLLHTGVPGLKLLLRVDLRCASTGGRARAAGRMLAPRSHATLLDPRDVFIELSGLTEVGADAAATAFAALRDRDIRVAALELGNGPASLLPDSPPADIVRIDGGWFRTVARQPSTARLFAALVRAYRSRSAEVLIDGIATEATLRAALDFGGRSFLRPAARPHSARWRGVSRRAVGNWIIACGAARHPSVPLMLHQGR